MLQDLRRHLKREYAKLLGLLQAYALIAAGVRIICTNQVGPPRGVCAVQDAFT